jgi:hypothetical protein
MVEIAPQPPGFIATPLDADNLPPLEQTAVVVPPPGQAAGLDEHAGERGYLRPCSAPAVAPGVGARRLAPRPDDDPAGSPSFRTRGGAGQQIGGVGRLIAKARKRHLGAPQPSGNRSGPRLRDCRLLVPSTVPRARSPRSVPQ